MSPMFIHPPYIWNPPYVQSFNRVFILLYHKMFSYFRGSHGGCKTYRVSICPLCSYTPYIWTPPYVQRVFIGYLFCFIIKCFPTLEAVMGVVRLTGCPYVTYVHTPHTFGHPHMFREFL